MSVCCSPAALRETPPAPPVTLLRYPAVNTSGPHPPQPPPPPPPPQELLLQQPPPRLKVKSIESL